MVGVGREQLDQWSALVTLVWRAGRWRTILCAALTGLQGVAPLAIAASTGLLVGAIPGVVKSGMHSSDGHRALLAVGLVTICMVADLILDSWTRYLAITIDTEYASIVHSSIADATLRSKTIATLEGPETASELAVLDEFERADGFLTTCQTLKMLMQFRSAGLIALVVLGYYVWWAPLVMILGWRTLNAASARWAKQGWELGAQLSATRMRRARYLRTLAVEPGPAKEVRVFGLGSWLLQSYAAEWLTGMTDIWSKRRRPTPSIILSTLILVAANAIVLAYVAVEASSGRVSGAGAAVALQAVIWTDGIGLGGDIQWATGRALNAALRVQKLAASTVGTAETLLSPRASRESGSAATVRLQNVTFAYDQSHRPVLDGVSLDIAPGQSLAIVGKNGVGKTTLIKLLCGLYDPDLGSITVDGKGPSQTAGLIGVIFQDFVRYQLSLRENVGFGSVALRNDDERLSEVVAAAGLEELIGRLPDGLETVLSSQYPGGVDLSGGQWQKVALARALLAIQGGAGLLVLDEPTSSLDVRAEHELFNRFLELTHNVTTILVTHRLSTVRNCDRIVVLCGGRLVEDGSHDELMQAEGHYFELFNLQAEQFSDRRVAPPEDAEHIDA